MAFKTDRSGAYRQRGKYSYAVIGVYVFLVLVAYIIIPRSTFGGWAQGAIIVVLLFYLARYLTTRYRIDDTHLRALRFPGARRIPLESVRQIEYSSMRDLSPSGFAGSWGWRGRMWSPTIGHFDAVYTDPAKGLLVTGDGVPIYLSPIDPEAFARELSRRVRSYTGRLAVDVGDPHGGASSGDGTAPTASTSTKGPAQ